MFSAQASSSHASEPYISIVSIPAIASNGCLSGVISQIQVVEARQRFAVRWCAVV